MIVFGARFNSLGQYTWVGSVGEKETGDDLYIGHVNPHAQYHDTQTGVPVDMPVKPSEFHVFDYATKQWVVDLEMAWMLVRIKRDRLMKETDWMVTKAVEIGEPMPPGWATYRQALRDVTKQEDPSCIAWPLAPN